MFANGQRIAAFRPTTHVYDLAGAPASWNDRALASLNTVSDKANAGLLWAFHPARLQTTTFTLASVLALAIVLIGRGIIPMRLERRERKLYFQPLWRRAMTLLLIPVLLLATMPAQAAFVPGEVFYYYHSDHLGSSNVTTDRAGNVK